MVHEELRQAGLTEGQIKVYIALLELGPSTNTHLARRTGLQSSTVYYCLNALVEKGFVTYVLAGKKRTYRAVDPREVLGVLERRREEVQSSLERFKSIVPDLNRLQLKGVEKHYSLVYEGAAGVRSAFNEILRTLKRGEEYYAINLGEEYIQHEEARRFFRTYHAKRAKQGIRVKLVSTPAVMPFVLEVFKGLRHAQLAITDQRTPTGIVIYDDRVLTIIWEKKPMAFVIHSKTNADRYKAYFQEVWRKAKPIPRR